MVMRYPYKIEDVGSNPTGPTNKFQHKSGDVESRHVQVWIVKRHVTHTDQSVMPCGGVRTITQLE